MPNPILVGGRQRIVTKAVKNAGTSVDPPDREAARDALDIGVFLCVGSAPFPDRTHRRGLHGSVIGAVRGWPAIVHQLTVRAEGKLHFAVWRVRRSVNREPHEHGLDEWRNHEPSLAVGE